MVYVNNHNLVNAVNGVMAANPIMKTLFVNPSLVLAVPLEHFLAPFTMKQTAVSVNAVSAYNVVQVPKGKLWRIKRISGEKASGTYAITYFAIVKMSNAAAVATLYLPCADGTIVCPSEQEVWADELCFIVLGVSAFTGAGTTNVCIQYQELDV